MKADINLNSKVPYIALDHAIAVILVCIKTWRESAWFTH